MKIIAKVEKRKRQFCCSTQTLIAAAAEKKSASNLNVNQQNFSGSDTKRNRKNAAEKNAFHFWKSFFWWPRYRSRNRHRTFFAAVEPKALGPGRLPVQTFYTWSNLSVQLFWMWTKFHSAVFIFLTLLQFSDGAMQRWKNELRWLYVVGMNVEWVPT